MKSSKSNTKISVATTFFEASSLRHISKRSLVAVRNCWTRNIVSSFWPWTITHPFELCRQIPKILFEALTVFCFSYAIHTWSFVSAQAVVAGSQVIHVTDVMIQTGKYQFWFLTGLFTYPCQVCSHYFSTPCIVIMLLLSQSINRGDLRSAWIRRFTARPLQHTGSHHSRRGHPKPLFLHWVRYSGTAIAGDSPRALDRRSPGYLPVVAQLDAVLDPGVSVSHSSVTCSPHGLRPSQKDRHGPKKITFLGAMCQIQGYTLHLAALVILLSDLVSSSFDY